MQGDCQSGGGGRGGVASIVVEGRDALFPAIVFFPPSLEINFLDEPRDPRVPASVTIVRLGVEV